MSDHESKPAKDSPHRSGTAVVWIVAVLVAAALALFVVQSRRGERVAQRALAPASSVPLEDVPPSGTTPAPITKVVTSAAPAPARPNPASTKMVPLSPLDLFAGDVPEVLRMTHQVTAGGGQLALGRMKELYQLGKDHPGDARPHLVMGADAMNRGWEAFAVDHYTRAQREDPRARQDPRMLKDLVAIAGGKREPSKAAAALTSIYGAAAIPAVEEALAEAGEKGDLGRVQQLADLSRQLAGPRP
jgi:hypothetical protein